MDKPNACILIVEDDPVTRRLTERVLAQAGYETVTAKTGEEGLRLAQASGPGAAPDLVLLDIVLPDISGVTVCRRIKQEGGERPPHVILLSGARTAPDEQALGLEEGADGYIARPVTNRELLARVEAMLRLRQMEAQLRQQERLAALGQMAGGLAHNLNSILQSLLLRTELMAADPQLHSRARRSLQQMAGETRKGAALVQQMLDFSRQAVMRSAAVDLAALAQETARELQDALPPGVSLRLALPPSPAEVWGDAGRLRQLLENLARNGIDALAHGGQLEISVQRAAVATSCSACQAPIEGEWLQLVVRDDGVGMSRAVTARAFEPFFTTRVPQRRGLGLSQALGIVKQHQGHIRLQSEEGQGTQVSVFLPPYQG